ncbi:aspartate aminotransferase [Cephaloticoccus primus]|uniref:cysteine-S-conjugate beta-lyase n=1 Tax=Cephaloticoccus primus TaxID=1548207 RepID=A0A139SQ68_9BACT|nr:PatB family C-S lyase [Cephaloticoccus primus]KXU36640.1 aspartate aminotransferase [Cephaloticoccus primus]
MQFDFTTPPERRGTDSQKWLKYENRDILPMWVADMDFRSAPAILDALHARIDHGIFGYARPCQSTTDAVVAAMQDRYGWRIDPSWIVWLPGLVCALNVTARAFADEGDEVLTLAPIYPPFMSAPKNGGRHTVTVPLRLDASGAPTAQWRIDWDALEAAVTPRTRLFLLCSPHNPIGRVWRRDELERIAEFCLRHDLILCSDEIHCDLILDPALKHTPSALLGPEIARRSLTLMAPSKTYNIPGLGTSLAIIPDAALRAQFSHAATGIVPEVNALGYAACEAAYRDCEPWRQALLDTLRTNRDHLCDFVRRELPGIEIEAPTEATYLAWLNVRALGLSDPVAHFEKHGVGLSDGAFFGAPAGHYVRLNFGCPLSTLDEALRRIKNGI